ncbi:hypothetical protein UY3_12573 [Chelonia mydas]|uniref:Uncharacterized protein n=1 Tax=Chelonia mydas TaxID=8469 RepID=M7BQA3_CHEMY|nr:hypothetical protein UY3_12573 [Chelonia mydas]
MSTLPAGSPGSNGSSGDRFIACSLDTINRSLSNSCTPPREVQTESTGEQQQSTHRSEDTMAVVAANIPVQSLLASSLKHICPERYVIRASK